MSHYFEINGYSERYCSRCWKRIWRNPNYWCTIYKAVLEPEDRYTLRCTKCISESKNQENSNV